MKVIQYGLLKVSIRNHIAGENQFIIAEDIAVFNKSTFLNIALS